jgi:hypothetical protein
MKYYRVQMGRGEKKELEKELSSLDLALLKRAENSGGDILDLLGAGKPFMNKYGKKEFATSGRIRKRINFLIGKGALERR